MGCPYARPVRLERVTITNDTCGTRNLGPNKSCAITVQFAPTSPRTDVATLTASSNGGATAILVLSGTGALTGHIYWANPGNDSIDEAKLDGAGPRELVSGDTVSQP